MKIAVLSGKGGTGKTLVSVNLAETSNYTYIDCDVEEPNGHLFFKPIDISQKDVTVKIPFIDHDKCISCRSCQDFCKFNALAYINDKIKVFEDICHSCSACKLLCKSGAINEKDKSIGKIISGVSGNVQTMSGFLNTGESSGVAIIKELLDMSRDVNCIIDCPPGSACVVMESIKEADYCILVAEPSSFGAHNLAMVHELVDLFDKKHGVILNKCMDYQNPSEEYCRKNNLDIICKIDFDYRLARLNSDSKVVARQDEFYRNQFTEILRRVREELDYERTSNPQW